MAEQLPRELMEACLAAAQEATFSGFHDSVLKTEFADPRRLRFMETIYRMGFESGWRIREKMVAAGVPPSLTCDCGAVWKHTPYGWAQRGDTIADVKGSVCPGIEGFVSGGHLQAVLDKVGPAGVSVPSASIPDKQDALRQIGASGPLGDPDVLGGQEDGK